MPSVNPCNIVDHWAPTRCPQTSDEVAETLASRLVSSSILERLGNSVMAANSVPVHLRKGVVSECADHSHKLLPALLHALDVDATFTPNPASDKLRGPVWSDNSCALDTVLMAMI